MSDLIKTTNDELPMIFDPSIKIIMDKLSESQRTRRMKATNPRRIKERAGKDGKTFKYVQRLDAMVWLDKNYPIWSFDVISGSYQELAGYVYVTGRLTVLDPITLKERTMTCIGAKEAIITKDTQKLAQVQYMKAAETDALKRATSMLGFANDVYTDVEVEDEKREENRIWYVVNVLPKVMNQPVFKNKPELLFKQILAFDAGVISREQLESII